MGSMQSDPIPAPPAADAAVLAPSGGPPTPAQDDGPVDGWVLDEIRTRTERMDEVIRSRNEWIEARRLELWERMDRLQLRLEARASDPGGRGVVRFPGPALPPSVATRATPAELFRSLAERIEAMIGIGPRPAPVAEGEGVDTGSFAEAERLSGGDGPNEAV